MQYVLVFVPLPFAVLLTQVEEQCGSLNAQEVANIGWALARMQVHPPSDWVETLMHQSAEEQEEMEARHVAMLLWALAEWRFVGRG